MRLDGSDENELTKRDENGEQNRSTARWNISCHDLVGQTSKKRRLESAPAKQVGLSTRSE